MLASPQRAAPALNSIKQSPTCPPGQVPFCGRLLIRALSAVLLLAVAAQAQNPDTFFAGTVSEIKDDAVVISRTVGGKTEKRTFQVTPETKVEGRLRTRVRVTVRYTANDDGDTATLIVVRAVQPAKKK